MNILFQYKAAMFGIKRATFIENMKPPKSSSKLLSTFPRVHKVRRSLINHATMIVLMLEKYKEVVSSPEPSKAFTAYTMFTLKVYRK